MTDRSTRERVEDLLKDARHTLDHYDTQRSEQVSPDWSNIRRDMQHIVNDLTKLLAALDQNPADEHQ